MSSIVSMTSKTRTWRPAAPRPARCAPAARYANAPIAAEPSVRASYDPDRPLMPWLLAIARRRIIDAGRRRMRQAGREVEFDERDVTFAAAETNTVDEDVLQTDALRIAIERLPRGQRHAVELLKMRELSLREASAATGLSIGALKVASHRAMATLRAKLKRYEH
jgi:RNA polymerase sigma-70 factor (ECF subfamily)